MDDGVNSALGETMPPEAEDQSPGVQNKQDKNMVKWLRVTLIVAGTLVGLLILVLAGVFSYLKTPQAQHLIQQQVNRLLPGKVTWGNIEFSLPSGSVAVSDLLIEGPSQERLGGVRRFQAEISWRALVKGRIFVEKARIENPWADLSIDENGRLNLMRAFPEPAPEKPAPKTDAGGIPFDVSVDDVRLSGGAVSYRDPRAQLAVTLEAISVAVDAARLSTPAGRLRLAVGGGRIESPAFTGPFEKINLAADLDADRLSPLSVEIKAGGTNIDLAGTVTRLGADPVLDVTLDAELALAEIRRLFKLDSELTGAARLHVDARGPASDPAAGVKLGYDGGVLGGVPVDRIRLALAVADRRVRIDSLAVASDIGTVDADGHIDLEKAFPAGFLSSERNLNAAGGHVTIGIDKLLLDKTLALARIDDIWGTVSGNVVLDGTPARPSATVLLSGRQIAFPEVAAGDLRIDADLDETGTVDIRSLTLDNRGSRVSVRGNIHLLEQRPDRMVALHPDLPVDLAIGLDHVEPGDFFQKQDVHGRIDGTLTVKGPVRTPELQADVAGKALAVGRNVIGDVEARVRTAEGRVLLSPVTVTSGRSEVSLTGSVGVMTPATGVFLKDPTLDLHVAGDAVYLDDFIKGMTGRLSLDGAFGGTVSRPKATVRVEGKNLNLSGQALAGVSLAARMDGRKITIDRFQAAVTPEETIGGEGTVDLGRSAYTGNLSTTGISLANVAAVGGRDAVTGMVSIDLSGAGTFDDPRAEGMAAATDLHVNGKPVEDFSLRLAVRDHVARVWGRPGFALEGRYHLDKKDFSASLGFDRTALAPYFRIAGQEDLGGTIDGAVTARGRSDAPHTLTVDADLKNLTLLSKGKELLSSPRIRARLDHNAYVLSDTEIRLPGDGRLHLRGEGNLAGTIAMLADGRVPMTVAAPFLDEGSDVRGAIVLDVRLGGTIAHPDIRGDITLDHLAMDLPGLAQRLHDVTGRVVISPGALTMENVAGRIDDGSFTVGGRVALENFKPVRLDVQATARKLPIEVPDTLNLLVDSRLNLAGTAEKSVLNGEIVLLEGRYTKDVELNLLKGVTVKTRATAPVASSEPMPFLSGMSLDIIVKRREPFVVENNVANMSLSPDLHILGTAARPVVSGRAAVDEGVLTYQKTEFEIQKGVVDFLNPYKTEPTIDIEGQAVVRDWTISLTVSGTPDNLKVALSSNPALEDADILSLLVVGKTLAELRQSDGGSGISARKMLGDVLADTVSSKVKAATGLDIVEMKVDDAADNNGTDDVTVTLGKELSRRLTVKYGAELKKGQTVQKVTSEYKILEDLLVSAFQDTDGNFGGALTFRMEFR